MKDQSKSTAAKKKQEALQGTSQKSARGKVPNTNGQVRQDSSRGSHHAVQNLELQQKTLKMELEHFNDAELDFDKVFERDYHFDELQGYGSNQLSSTQRSHHTQSQIQESKIGHTKHTSEEDNILESMQQLLNQVNHLKAAQENKQKPNFSKYLNQDSNQPSLNKIKQSQTSSEQSKPQDSTPQGLQQLDTATPQSTQSQENHHHTQVEPFESSPLSKQKQTFHAMEQEVGTSNYASQVTATKDVNKDVIERLFSTHKKYLQNNEKRKEQQYQQEMSHVKEKPSILYKSQKMALKTDRGGKPIYSPERYKKDMENLKIRREAALKRREMEELEKKRKEDEEIAKNFVHKGGQKLDLHEFYQKYNSQISKYEQKKRINEEMRQSLLYASGVKDQSPPRFAPNISQKTKNLTKNQERIDKRLNDVQSDKQKMITDLKKQFESTFTPNISKNSQRLAQTSQFKQKKFRATSPLLGSMNNDMFAETMKGHYQSIKNATNTISSNTIGGQVSKTPTRDTRTPTKASLISKPTLKQPAATSRNSVLPQSLTEKHKSPDDLEMVQNAILQEYLKLKEEMNESLTKRSSEIQLEAHLQNKEDDQFGGEFQQEEGIEEQMDEYLQEASSPTLNDSLLFQAVQPDADTMIQLFSESQPMPKIELIASSSEVNVFQTPMSVQDKYSEDIDVMHNIMESIQQMANQISNMDQDKGKLGDTQKIQYYLDSVEPNFRISKSLVDLKEELKSSISKTLNEVSVQESKFYETQKLEESLLHLEIGTMNQKMRSHSPQGETEQRRASKKNKLPEKPQTEYLDHSYVNSSQKVTPQYIKEKLIQKIDEKSRSSKRSSQQSPPYPGNATSTLTNHKRHTKDQSTSKSPHNPYAKSRTLNKASQDPKKIENKNALEYLKNTSKTQISQVSAEKSEEIVQRILRSNSSRTGESFVIPDEVLQEMEENGLDSMTILRLVLREYQHLFSNE